MGKFFWGLVIYDIGILLVIKCFFIFIALFFIAICIGESNKKFNHSTKMEPVEEENITAVDKKYLRLKYDPEIKGYARVH